MGNCCSSDPPPRKEQKQIQVDEIIPKKENNNNISNKSVLVEVAETEPLHESQQVEKESNNDHSIENMENNSVQEQPQQTQQQQIDEIQEAEDDDAATSLANTAMEETHQEQEISGSVDEAAAFFALNDTVSPQQHEADINNYLPQQEHEPVVAPDVTMDESVENVVESNQIDGEKEQHHHVHVPENATIQQEEETEKNINEEFDGKVKYQEHNHEEALDRAEDELSQPQQEDIFVEKVPEPANNAEDESVADQKNQDPSQLQNEASPTQASTEKEEEKVTVDDQPENIEVNPTKADDNEITQKPEEVEQQQQQQKQETPADKKPENVDNANSETAETKKQPENISEKSEEKLPEPNLTNPNPINNSNVLKPESIKKEEPVKNRVEPVPQEQKNSKTAANENKNKNTSDKTIIESWDDDFTIPTEIIKKKFVTELVDAPDDLIQVLVNNNVDARILQILRDNNVDGPRFAQPGFISTFFQSDETKNRGSQNNKNNNSGSLYLGHLIRIRNNLLADAGLSQLCVLASSPMTTNQNSKNNHNSSKSLSSSTSSLVLKNDSHNNNNHTKPNEPSDNIFSFEQLTETQKQVEIQKLPQLFSPTSTNNSNTNNNFDSILSESIKMLEPFAMNNNNNTLPSHQQHQVETEMAKSKTGRVCTVLHKTLTKLQKVNRGARGPCLDLCEKLRTTIVSPSNGITDFLNANMKNEELKNDNETLFIPEFKRFLSILRESQNWIARFVPPSENASLSLGTKYFEGLTAAYSEDLKRIQEKLEHAKNEISLIQQQRDEKNASGLLLDDEKKMLVNLQEKCREWYSSYFSSSCCDVDGASSFEIYDFELKILRLQQNKIASTSTTSSSKSKETSSDIFEKSDESLLMNRGECFDVENLQHLLMLQKNDHNNNKDQKNVILLEGPCGGGKRTFCKKICRSQCVKGALTIFVDLKKVLSALTDRRKDETKNTSDEGDENTKTKIETVTDFMSLVNAPVAVKLGLEDIILKKEIPIIWILDNYDEVKRESNDVTLNEFLQNFESSQGKTEVDGKAKKLTQQSTFLRTCDSVILYSSSSSSSKIIRNSFHIIIQRWQKRDMESYAKNYFQQQQQQQVSNNNNNLAVSASSSSLSLSMNPKSPLSSSRTLLSSSYYNTVATKRNADGSTASSLTDSEISALIDQGITNSSLQFPTSLHGIPLFVHLLCEAKLNENNFNANNMNAKLDLSFVCPPFLFHRHLRFRFDQAKIKINYILDSNNTAFVRFINNLSALYDHILEESSKFAFDEFLAHRGNILSFSIPRDEKLPLWIAVMREMGILSVDTESENTSNNDDMSTTFSFPHKLYVEFLAALHVASNPILNLLFLPFSNDCETVWVFVCQMCLLKEVKIEEFFKRYLNTNFTSATSSNNNNKNDNNGGKITYQSISTQLLTTHVAGRALTLYKSLSEDDRHSTAREEVLNHSEQCGIKLLIQIAALLPKNLAMDALLEKHGGFMARKAPSQFRWMTEWCGVYGALDVLLWFEGKDRFKKEVLTREACRLAVSRSMLHHQNIPQIQKCSEFLLPRAGDLSPLDAIAVESTVALQQALRTSEYTLADDDLALNIFFAALEKINTNPNLFACLALCVDLENILNTTNWNLARFLSVNKKVNNDEHLKKWFLIALALQVAIPEIVEIWNPELRFFERVKFADEVKKRSNGLVLLFDDQSVKNAHDRDAAIEKLSSAEYSQLTNDAKSRFGSEKFTQILMASQKVKIN